MFGGQACSLARHAIQVQIVNRIIVGIRVEVCTVVEPGGVRRDEASVSRTVVTCQNVVGAVWVQEGAKMAVPSQRIIRDVSRLIDDVAEGVIDIGRRLAVSAGNGCHVAAKVVREGIKCTSRIDIAFDSAGPPDIELIGFTVLELCQQIACAIVIERKGIDAVAGAVAEAEGVVGIGPSGILHRHGRHATVLCPCVGGMSV